MRGVTAILLLGVWGVCAQDLYLYTGFERDCRIYYADGRYKKLNFSEEHFTDGVKGAGYYCEMGGANLLPEIVAEPQKGFSALGSAELKYSHSDSGRILSVKVGTPGDGVLLDPVQIRLSANPNRTSPSA